MIDNRSLDIARTALEQQHQVAVARPWATTITRPRTRRITPFAVIQFSILFVSNILWCALIAWMLTTSLKPGSQIITYPRWFPLDILDPTLKDYDATLKIDRGYRSRTE